MTPECVSLPSHSLNPPEVWVLARMGHTISPEARITYPQMISCINHRLDVNAVREGILSPVATPKEVETQIQSISDIATILLSGYNEHHRVIVPMYDAVPILDTIQTMMRKKGTTGWKSRLIDPVITDSTLSSGLWDLESNKQLLLKNPKDMMLVASGTLDSL
jgi:hypothetical protein